MPERTQDAVLDRLDQLGFRQIVYESAVGLLERQGLADAVLVGTA